MPRTTNRSIATACALIAWLWLAPPAVMAQRAVQPRVSVVTFEGSGAPREARDAMADELAARLVDSGHFRVLHREWLPHEDDQVPALDALRTAAASVDVDYLVFGSIRQSTSRIQAQRRTTLFVDVRVLDVASANVIRTASASRTFATPNDSHPPLLALPLVSRSPILAVAAIAKMAIARSNSSSTRLTKDWRHLVQDVSRQLDARGLPPVIRR